MNSAHVTCTLIIAGAVSACSGVVGNESTISGGGEPASSVTRSGSGRPPSDIEPDVPPGTSPPAVGETSAGGGASSGDPIRDRANDGGAGKGGKQGEGGANATGDGLPCAVRAIVKEHCATCHGATPTFGAPMPLQEAADFRAISKQTSQSEGQLAIARVADEARPMPPPPNPRLSATEIATLGDWIKAGAPDQSCASPSSDAGPSRPTSGSDGEALPDDVKCYTMTARASAKNDKYDVPTTPDLYQCFDYVPPWGNKKVQVVRARPIIDNPRVIHHWILYNGAAAVTDGANSSCVGAHPNAAFITGWAPGGDGLDLPRDVGLRTESGGFSLEVHYNNTAGAGQLDASGAEVCVTEKLRPNEAAVHWLGTQTLNKMSASGTCTPANTGPVTILTSSPHMHLQGRHMTTTIKRKGGTTEKLIDVPFDFNTQISYPTKAVINVGDTLTTTCTYAKPTPFGQGTNQEMCYNFVVAYPAGQLAQSFQLLRKYDCTGL